MASTRLVYHVYHTIRSQYDDIHKQDKDKSKHAMYKWCTNIHTLLKSIDMEDTWHKNTLTESEARQWRNTTNQRENQSERRSAVEGKNATQTETANIQTTKDKLRFEHTYLTTRDREAREVMTRLRGGTNELRIETGRYAITN